MKMSKKQLKTVWLPVLSLWELDNCSPKEVIEKLEDYFSKIPEEYLDTARTSLDSDLNELDCYYKRPETEEELYNRVNKHKINEELIKERELKELARLKEKYET